MTKQGQKIFTKSKGDNFGEGSSQQCQCYLFVSTDTVQRWWRQRLPNSGFWIGECTSIYRKYNQVFADATIVRACMRSWTPPRFEGSMRDTLREWRKMERKYVHSTLSILCTLARYCTVPYLIFRCRPWRCRTSFVRPLHLLVLCAFPLFLVLFHATYPLTSSHRTRGACSDSCTVPVRVAASPPYYACHFLIITYLMNQNQHFHGWHVCRPTRRYEEVVLRTNHLTPLHPSFLRSLHLNCTESDRQVSYKDFTIFNLLMTR